MTYFFSVWNGSSVYVRGVTLVWFRSYLSRRSYCVWFTDSVSRTVYVVCSVPQGVSPRPTTVYRVGYSADLADRAVEHDVYFHGYADDTQFTNITIDLMK